MAKTVKLVSPDGKLSREVEVDSKEEVALRWDGYLPEKQQAAKAPERPTGQAPKTVGSNA